MPLDDLSPSTAAPCGRCVGLPEKTSRQEHWQIAVHHLMLAAERGGIMMLARIAMLKAIHHGSEPEKPARRKRAARVNKVIR